MGVSEYDCKREIIRENDYDRETARVWIRNASNAYGEEVFRAYDNNSGRFVQNQIGKSNASVQGGQGLSNREPGSGREGLLEIPSGRDPWKILGKQKRIPSIYIIFSKNMNVKNQDVLLQSIKDKNYFRLKLLEAGKEPFILTGKFKKIWDNYVTFTTIRPYIPNEHPATICNHINILKGEVAKSFDLRDLIFNHKYYFICYCKPYEKQERFGIRLAFDHFKQPFFRLDVGRRVSKSIVEQCYQFSIDDFRRSKDL